MNTRKVDILNIILLLVSVILGYLLPFRLFLYAYAILGPLHYLTEINWLQEKNFFLSSKQWVWIPIVFVILILIPKLFLLPPLGFLLENEDFKLFLTAWEHWSNGLILLWLLSSIGLVFTKGKSSFWLFFALGLLFTVLLGEVNSYLLILGILIPSVIHVYLFTVFFMLFGAIKSRSTPAYISVVLILMAPFFISIIEINPKSYIFSERIKSTFLDNNFHVLITKLSAFLGLSDGKSFYFYSKLELKFQIFLAFAYTYHYLNWFSKTSVIGWHKRVSTSRAISIISIWLISIGLYTYDYTLGFILLMSLSMLHVLLEFPLNILSMKGVGNWLFSNKA
ncbi:MAG: hypothetical protein AAFY45_03210 [Bacteroidota bacterium]